MEDILTSQQEIQGVNDKINDCSIRFNSRDIVNVINYTCTFRTMTSPSVSNEQLTNLCVTN